MAVLLFDSQCERESKQMKRQSNRHQLTPLLGSERPNRLPYVQRFFLAVSSDKSIIPCFSTLFNEIPVPAGGEEGAAQKEKTKNFSKTLDTSPKLW